MAKKQEDLLQALLSADQEVTGEVTIKRLGTLVFKAIGSPEFNELQEQCTFYTGKGDTRKKTVDEDALNGLLIAKSCVNLDFSNDKLLEKYGAADEGDCVLKALKLGEISRIHKKIFEISGFAEDEEDIKNG